MTATSGRLRIAGCLACAGLMLAVARPANGAGWIPPQPLTPEVAGGVKMNDSGHAAILSHVTDGASARLQASFHRPGVAGWLAPEVVSSPGGYANYASIELDPAGTAVAAWVREDGSYPHIQAVIRPVGGGWSSPVNLTPPTDLGDWGVPEIALDAAGNATVAWVSQRDGRLYTSYRPVGGAWSTPAAVASAQAGYRALAVAPSGKAVVVWRNAGDGTIKAVRGELGVWEAPVTIDSAPSISSIAAVVAPSGEAVAAWTVDDLHNVTEPLRAAYMTSAGQWQPAETVSGPARAEGVQLVVDGSGNVTAVWHGTSDVERIWAATHRPFTGWTGSQQISTTGAREWPQAAVNSAGRVVAVWAGGGGAVLAASRDSAAAPWTAAATLRQGTGGWAYPSVGVDGIGHAVATWTHQTSSGTFTSAWSVHDAVPPVITSVSAPSQVMVGEHADFSVSAFDLWSPLEPPTWSFGGLTIFGTIVSPLFAVPGHTAFSVGVTDLAQNSTSATRSVDVQPRPRPPTVRRCVVPRLRGKTLAQARRALVRVRCRLGRVSRSRARRALRGRVIAQRPKAGTRLAVGAKVRVTLGRR